MTENLGASVRAYLERMGYSIAQTDIYADIQTWLDWYRNDVRSFHHYFVYNGMQLVGVDRYRLGMAKTACEDHANLLMNERVQITADSFDSLDDILRDAHFRPRANRLVEIAYALGTGAFVEYMGADGKPVIDCVRADMIYPLAFDGTEVTECAFASSRIVDGKEGCYIQIHREGARGYELQNVWLDDSGKEIPPPAGVESFIETGSPVPLFQLITPNIINNARLDSPMGASVYANAISQLMALDVVYDSYVNEFILGRKRIIVPLDLAAIKLSESGQITPIFDPRDTTFYAMGSTGDDDNKIQEIDMTLRAAEHDTALQKQLDLFSKKVGLGTGYYRFDAGSVSKTATEVVSAQSELYKNRQKNQLPIEAAVCGMVRALSYLSGGSPDIDVTIDFDDSIIEDKQSVVQTNVLLVNSGLRSKVDAIMEIDKCSEDEARAKLGEINDESSVSMGASDMLALAPEAGGDAAAVVDEAEDVAGKTLNGAQTQSLIGVMQQYQAGQLTEGQAVNIIAVSIGVTKAEARVLLQGAE